MPSSPLSTRRGVFFSFEGIDGSGKSTQARLLADALTAAGHAVVTVREPGGTPLGEAVRALLLNPEASISPRAEALLFAAARAQLVSDVIEPALHAGHHVIADRYVDSTTAYQGAGRSLGDTLDSVSAFATGGRLPDRTYLVTVSQAEARRRRSVRPADRMELPDEAFRGRVAAAYARIATAQPGRILSVNGAQPVEAISRLIERDAEATIRTLAFD